MGGAMVVWSLLQPEIEAGLQHPAPEARRMLVLGGGLALLVLGGLAAIFRRRLGEAMAPTDEEGDDPAGKLPVSPTLALFLISFVVLFVELTLIRYCSSQIRIFSFYKNITLISCFLGLGIGCFLGGGRDRHALRFLFWTVPLSIFLSQGVLAVDALLSRWAAQGSSEHILGDAVTSGLTQEAILGRVLVALFCVVVMVSITLLFALLGRLLATSFEPLGRLRGYTVNILGSLAGILAFLLASYFETPPWVWFLVGLAPLLLWIPKPSSRMLAVLLLVVNVVAVAPDYGNTVWSPYQKLVGFPVEIPELADRTGYLVQISDVFYQVALDLSPEANAKRGINPFPHYDGAYQGLPTPEKVLIVGAGTGNDVAAALRAGASQVDAVDIDPAIVAMGREHHPEKPYSDPRVRVVVDDARSAFRKLPQGTYDAVVFGLLDSHTQLGISSVRLDNYVFTRESFSAAQGLLRPGGHIIVAAAILRPWFDLRMRQLLQSTCGEKVEVSQAGHWFTYRCRMAEAPFEAGELPEGLTLPTDDWPFLYLPDRGIPGAYLLVVALLVLASVGVLSAHRMRIGRFSSFHGHMFFLGAAFLLMEVYAINRLALLFGTTWLVSAVTIAVILSLIVAANLILMLFERVPYAFSYGGLVLCLLVGHQIDPSRVLGQGLPLTLAYAFGLLLPIFFAGLIFARSFGQAQVAGPALGANILGSVLGGWVEYATMAVGIRAMALLALVFYLASLLGLLRWKREG